MTVSASSKLNSAGKDGQTAGENAAEGKCKFARCILRCVFVMEGHVFTLKTDTTAANAVFQWIFNHLTVVG